MWWAYTFNVRNERYTMPNQRDKSKRRVYAWIPEDLKKEVQKILEKRGSTISDEILKAMLEVLKEGDENDKRTNKKD